MAATWTTVPHPMTVATLESRSPTRGIISFFLVVKPAILVLFFVSLARPVMVTLGTSARGGTFRVVDWLSRRFGPSFTENLARKKSCPLGESLLSSSSLCLINQVKMTIYNHMKPSCPNVFPNLSCSKS
ncbi:unnamed protein product [Musa hybrid cultivar]